MAEIKITTYEQDRLNHFEYLMDKANRRYERLYARFKDAPYLSAEAQALSDSGREVSFLTDVVEMLKVYRKQEWISVEDRLPENSDQILIYLDNGNIEVGYYDTDDNKFHHILPMPRVTHWMPLPQPPKMKGGAE